MTEDETVAVINVADLGTAKGFIEDVIAELDRHHPARHDLLLAISCISRAVDALDGGAA